MTLLSTLGGIGWLMLAHCLYPLRCLDNYPRRLRALRNIASVLASAVGLTMLTIALASVESPAWGLLAAWLTWIVVDVEVTVFRIRLHYSERGTQ